MWLCSQLIQINTQLNIFLYFYLLKLLIKSLKYISVKNFRNYFKASLEITKKEVEEIKLKYRKKSKIYKK